MLLFSLPYSSSFNLRFLRQIPICCSLFVFKLYHKTCEQFYRNFGIYEKSPNSFLPGLPHSIVNQFDFHNFLCLCLASVHLPYPFHLVSAFCFSVTPFRFASSGTISSMRFRAASSILAQYCLTYTQLWDSGIFYVSRYSANAFSSASSSSRSSCGSLSPNCSKYSRMPAQFSRQLSASSVSS